VKRETIPEPSETQAELKEKRKNSLKSKPRPMSYTFYNASINHHNSPYANDQKITGEKSNKQGIFV
jgi:hypothetical protein